MLLATGVSVACGSRTDLDVPPPPKPVFIGVAAGYNFSCALHAGGTVKCWGGNADGQLGNGTTLDSTMPTPVAGLTGAIAITAGDSHACALLSGGTVRCWGLDQSGQLGDGVPIPGPLQTTPVTVAGLVGAIAISAGSDFTCALLSGGTVECWGDNSVGGLGDGTTVGSSSPVPVAGVAGATSIGAGYYSACAALASGAAACWGDNSQGELGTPACPNDTNSTQWCPQPRTFVPGFTGTVGVAAANFGSCAWSDRSVDCWGLNIGGYLGNGGGAAATTWGPDPPGAVTGLSDASFVTMGQFHACALTGAGDVECWGQNHSGQMGNGPGSDAYTPVAGGGLASATAVAAGGDHTCAVVAGQTIWCWGSDANGELGVTAPETCDTDLGSTPCATTPVPVPWGS